MPMFDFKCTNENCGLIEQKLVPVDRIVTVCSKCARATLKQFSIPAAFNLKGDGFYKQGYN